VPPGATGAVAYDGAPPQPAAGNFLDGLFAHKPAAEPTQVAAADSGSREQGGSSFFGSLFSSNGSSTKQANAAGGLRGSDSMATGSATQKSTAAAGLRPKPKSETAKSDIAKSEPAKSETAKTETAKSETHNGEPQQAKSAKQTPTQQEANAAAPSANNGSLLKGAQPVVPAGNFDSRWGGLQ
jgi:hypothetical protein